MNSSQVEKSQKSKKKKKVGLPMRPLSCKLPASSAKLHSKIGKSKQKKSRHSATKNGKMSSGSSTKRTVTKRPQLFPEMDDYPMEILALLGENMHTADRLSMQTAFPNTRTSIAMKSSRQKKLCLYVDKNDYKAANVYQVDGKFSVPMLPQSMQCEVNEKKYVVGLKDLLKTSQKKLIASNSSVEQLKIVLNDLSKGENYWLPKVCKIIAAFSAQLTSLQIVIGKSPGHEEFVVDQAYLNLGDIITTMNAHSFPQLKLFMLFDESTGYIVDVPVKLLSQVEECYLMVNSLFFKAQLDLLTSNESLRKLGFIVETIEDRLPSAITPQLAGKIVHVVSRRSARNTPLYPEPVIHRLSQFSALTHVEFGVNSISGYSNLLTSLSQLSHLQDLALNIQYHPDPVLRDDGVLHLPPLPSVTSLKVTLLEINWRNANSFLTHNILHKLAITRQFVSLQSFRVYLFGKCTICKDFLYSVNCLRQVLEPLTVLDHLTDILAETHRPIIYRRIVNNILRVIRARRVAAQDNNNNDNNNV